MKNSKHLLKALRNNFSIEKSLEVFKKIDKTSRTNIQNFGKSFIDSFNKKPQGFGRFNRKNNNSKEEEPQAKEEPKKEAAKKKE